MNEFWPWRQLHRQFLPSTRQRSLAFAQALSAYLLFLKETAWNARWRWADGTAVWNRATTQMSLSQQRWYGVAMQRWENTYSWLWLTARHMVTSQRQSCPMTRHARCWRVWHKAQKGDGPTPIHGSWQSLHGLRKDKEKGKYKGKGKEENGLQPGAIYVAKVVGVAWKAKEKTEENRKERGVNQKERTKVKESLDRISAVTICNLVMGQEIALTRCVSSRVIKGNSSNNLAKRRCSITVSWRTRQTMQFYSSKFKQLKTEESVQHWYAEFVIRVYGIRFRCVTTTQEAPEELGWIYLGCRTV